MLNSTLYFAFDSLVLMLVMVRLIMQLGTSGRGAFADHLHDKDKSWSVLQNEVVAKMQEVHHPLVDLVLAQGDDFFSGKNQSKNNISDMKGEYTVKGRRGYMNDGQGNQWSDYRGVDEVAFSTMQIYVVEAVA